MLNCRRLSLAASVLVFASGIPQAAECADPTTPSIVFADATIRIPSEANNWTRKDILIKGENMDPAAVGDNSALSSQDLYVEGPTELSVKLQNFRAMKGSGKSRVWLADAVISKLPADSNFKRRILFSYGTVSIAFDYSITNRPEGTFTWSVKPAVREILLNKSRMTSLAISTGDIAATNVHIALSSLQDETTKDSLGREYLQLCIIEGNKCTSEPFSIARHNSSQPVVLKVDSTFSRPGVFKGMVWIGVDQKADPDSFELTVYSTRLRWQLFGTLCIILGLALWWFVSVFARQRAARVEALIPLAELRESVQDLLPALRQTEEACGCQMLKTSTRLDEIIDELDPNKTPALAGLIPGAFPSISGLAADVTAGLKQYLDNYASQVAALAVLVRQGGSAVLSKQMEAINARKGKLISLALKALDDAAEDVKTVDEARSKLGDIINNIQNGLTEQVEQDAGQMVRGTMAFVPSVATTKELRLESRELSSTVWAIWGAATVVTGVTALILTNPGFGTGLDFIKCFLWGLSIQAVGQQLQQLTPGAVTTSLKIPVSK